MSESAAAILSIALLFGLCWVGYRAIQWVSSPPPLDQMPLLVKMVAVPFLAGYQDAVQKPRSRSKAEWLEKTRSLDPEEFEQTVGTVWENRGYRIDLTPSGADGGIDVLARAYDDDFLVAIQAKCYSEGNRVGAPTVRQVSGAAKQFGADHAAVVTSSSFTEPAEEAGEALGIELIDGEDLFHIYSGKER